MVARKYGLGALDYRAQHLTIAYGIPHMCVTVALSFVPPLHSIIDRRTLLTHAPPCIPACRTMEAHFDAREDRRYAFVKITLRQLQLETDDDGDEGLVPAWWDRLHKLHRRQQNTKLAEMVFDAWKATVEETKFSKELLLMDHAERAVVEADDDEIPATLCDAERAHDLIRGKKQRGGVALQKAEDKVFGVVLVQHVSLILTIHIHVFRLF